MKEQKEYKNNVGGVWNRKADNKKQTPYKWLVINLEELREQGIDLDQEKVGLVMFRNFTKNKETHPDYQLYIPEKQEVYSPKKKDYVPYEPKKKVTQEDNKEDTELYNESQEIPF